jgi:hypothetical protein
LTPTPIPVDTLPTPPAATETFVEQTTPLTSTGNEPPAVSALPAPGVDDEADLISDAEQMPTNITPVPPVSFSTVMTPRRILWLFIIGLIVFTVSYGVQVVIWYRFKR